MAGPLYVKVDWNRDGDFADALEDVSDDQRGTITASYGREASTALTQVSAGRGSFDLDNSTRRYSPRNAASPLFGKVKPARPVLITRDVTVAGVTSTFTILRAHTDDQPLTPDLEQQRVSMTLVDSLQDLRGITISTPLYTGIRTGTAVGAVLDAAGWTGGRDIDAGATIIPYWWEDGTDAMDALQKLLASEGPPALLAVGVSGEIVFRDRHHRIIRTASKTSQATLRGTETAPEPVMERGFTYNDGWGNVVNSPTVAVPERSPTTTSVVWQSNEIITIGASASYVVVLQSSDPFMNALTPVAGTDFEIGSGGIASVTLSRTSGQSTSITFTATGAGASIGGVQLRAVPVPVARTWQVSASSAAQSTANVTQSVADYGQRGIPSGLEPVWAGRYDAQALCDLYVLQRAQPLTVLSVRFMASDLQQLRLKMVLALDLSDRVTVIEPESQVSGDFYVESIAHTIDGHVSHEIILGVEAVPAVPSSTAVFILGTSTLNGSDPLGY